MGMFSWLSELIGGNEPSATCTETETVSCVATEVTVDSSASAEWHNGFGTAADYQVPAEQYDNFQSNDWSSASDCWSSSDAFSHD